MAYELRLERRVEFCETDAAGIVHFSNFFRFFEQAEHALLRSVGLGVHFRIEQGDLGFPRLASRCEFLRPARFEDLLEIHVWVARLGRTSVTYSATAACRGERLAQGETTAVACIYHETKDGVPQPLRAVELPAAFRERLQIAPYPPLVFRESVGATQTGETQPGGKDKGIRG